MSKQLLQDFSPESRRAWRQAIADAFSKQLSQAELESDKPRYDRLMRTLNEFLAESEEPEADV